MNSILNLFKNYISPVTLILMSLLLFTFSGTNAFIEDLMKVQLPFHGKPLAFTMFLSLIVLYELVQRDKTRCRTGNTEVKEHIKCLQAIVEKANLVSDVNAAFTEFQSNSREFITGEYYIKEIMTLSDTRERLGVNSYTQNKLNFLMSKIKH